MKTDLTSPLTSKPMKTAFAFYFNSKPMKTAFAFSFNSNPIKTALIIVNETSGSVTHTFKHCLHAPVAMCITPASVIYFKKQYYKYQTFFPKSADN